MNMKKFSTTITIFFSSLFFLNSCNQTEDVLISQDNCFSLSCFQTGWTEDSSRRQTRVVTDSEGKDVAYANSLWVYMDMEKGRPSRPEESEIAPYGVGDPYEMEYESRKIALPKEAKELERFPVRRYHIDTNEHVNNCQYVQMALESLPKDKEVHQMRVEYKKSAVYGDVIYPRIAIEEDRTVIELCNEKARPYAVIEFKFA